jgi:hypothetical protein
MKLICERTTFIPGFCVFALHHNGFGASQPPGQSTTHRPRAVTRKGSVRTYHQGQNWVEQPGAHHLLTENTSRTKPAKLLVIFISNTGDKLKVDDQPK